jgi:hypothetical protein
VTRLVATYGAGIVGLAILLLALVAPLAGAAAAFTRKQPLRTHAKMALLSLPIGLVPMLLGFLVIAATIGPARTSRDAVIAVGLFDFLSVFAFWSAVFVRRGAARRHAEALRPLITRLRATGLSSATAIARALNDQRILTPRGGVWHGASVKRLLARLDEGTRQYARKPRPGRPHGVGGS